MAGSIAFGSTMGRFSIPSSAGRSIAVYVQRVSTRSSQGSQRKRPKKDMKPKANVKKYKTERKKKEISSKVEASKSPWTRKLETEEYSKFLGYKLCVQHIVTERLLLKTLGGPGTYDVDTNTFKRGLMHNGKVFTTAKRWDPQQKCDAPPVGTYNPGAFKESSLRKENLTKAPPFEWDGLQDRFKPSYDRKWKISPNQYMPKDAGGVEALMSKVVSTRGPYNCFTGPRDGSTIKNHFTVCPNEGADEMYNTCDGLDFLLTHPQKKNYGVIYKTPYMVHEKQACRKRHKHNDKCYLVPDTPGPTTYNINWHTIKKEKRSKAPFNSSVQYCRHTIKQTISPGPGRYFPNRKKFRARKKNSTIFESKLLLNILTSTKPPAFDQKSIKSTNEGKRSTDHFKTPAAANGELRTVHYRL